MSTLGFARAAPYHCRMGPRIALLAVVLLLVGCATAPAERAVPPPDLFEDRAFAPPPHAPDVQSIFALSPRMRRYIEHDIAASIRLHSRSAIFARHRESW